MRSADIQIGRDYAYVRYGAREAKPGHTTAKRVRVLEKDIVNPDYDAKRRIRVAPYRADDVIDEARTSDVLPNSIIMTWAQWDTESRVVLARQQAERERYEREEARKEYRKRLLTDRLKAFMDGEDFGLRCNYGGSIAYVPVEEFHALLDKAGVPMILPEEA